MTKKDYIVLAARLKVLRQSLDNGTTEPTNQMRLAVWGECVMAIMPTLAADNPAFHRGKFLAACGVPNIGMK